MNLIIIFIFKFLQSLNKDFDDTEEVNQILKELEEERKKTETEHKNNFDYEVYDELDLDSIFKN